MSPTTVVFVATLTATSLLGGCGDDDADDAPRVVDERGSEPLPEAPSGPAAPSAGAPTATEVPIPEDFADNAEADVDDASYREQLERIAADIETDLEAGADANPVE
jgi:hypothetical protein